MFSWIILYISRPWMLELEKKNEHLEALWSSHFTVWEVQLAGMACLVGGQTVSRATSRQPLCLAFGVWVLSFWLLRVFYFYSVSSTLLQNAMAYVKYSKVHCLFNCFFHFLKKTPSWIFLLFLDWVVGWELDWLKRIWFLIYSLL